MQTKPKRPLSVWFAQIFLLFYGVVFALLGIFMFSEAAELEGWHSESATSLAIVHSAFGISMIVAFLSMALRWSWGRQFSLVVFLVVAVTVVYQFVTNPEEDPPSVSIDFALIFAPLFFLFVAPLISFFLIFMFGSKVKKFFAGVVDPEFTDPPPPPTFES